MSNSQWHEDQEIGERAQAQWDEEKRTQAATIKTLTRALEWYADQRNYNYRGRPNETTEGDRAREALGKVRNSDD